MEARIFDALGSELMRPELVAEFVAELNRLASGRGSDLSAKRRELPGARARCPA
ncbi:hypothetical protein [Roseococcus sp. YIM B11640]|uniref:hypothetical protein n=1 Tax=Roseococcus sp. YIM B11640 TaxID=3133973 RepID=UPI003C7ADA02